MRLVELPSCALSFSLSITKNDFIQFASNIFDMVNGKDYLKKLILLRYILFSFGIGLINYKREKDMAQLRDFLTFLF